jgi:hypothetical protein
MAQQKIATLMGTERLGADTRLLSFSMTDGDLGFYGGQYIIIDSGIVIAGDRQRPAAVPARGAENRRWSGL